MDGVQQVLTMYIGIRSYIKYFTKLFLFVRNRNFFNIIITEHTFAFVPKLILFRFKNILFDIRSISVEKSAIKRKIQNFVYKICSVIYPNCTVITEYVARYYKIPIKKVAVLPIGSNIMCKQSKKYNELHLLYIGFLRDGLENTIEGFKLFKESNTNCDYTIIGYNNRLKPGKNIFIEQKIRELNLQDSVFFKGRLSHEEAIEYFNYCNVGVSYIPVTSYFDHQPPTKTFEYLLSGMLCIATKTSANKEIINDLNGILVDDDPRSFANGLKYILLNRSKYSSDYIRSSQIEFVWENIINTKLKPILTKIELAD